LDYLTRDEAVRDVATVVLADQYANLLGKVSYLVGREKEFICRKTEGKIKK
jgi:hypothetical protein